MTLVVNSFFPFGLSSDWTLRGLGLGLIFYLTKMVLLACLIVLVETTNAKLRLFRVPELLMVSFILGALALISTFLFLGFDDLSPGSIVRRRGHNPWSDLGPSAVVRA